MISLLRHGLMESGIKYSYHRYAWHQFLAGTDTDQVCRVVKRCQIVALFDRLSWTSSLMMRGGSEFLSAVYDTDVQLHRSRTGS